MNIVKPKSLNNLEKKERLLEEIIDEQLSYKEIENVQLNDIEIYDIEFEKVIMNNIEITQSKLEKNTFTDIKFENSNITFEFNFDCKGQVVPLSKLILIHLYIETSVISLKSTQFSGISSAEY